MYTIFFNVLFLYALLLYEMTFNDKIRIAYLYFKERWNDNERGTCYY